MLRSATITIQREGRDQGGVFVLTEKPAYQQTDWFIRAMQILARSGADVPAGIMNNGIEGFLAMGLGTILTGLGKAPIGEVRPLLEELLSCVTSYQPPGATQPLAGWQLIRGQIQDPATIFQLYEEVLSLHLGFSLTAKLLGFQTLAVTMIRELMPTTETSTELSPSLSEAA
jgi:hypothetical protein